MSDAYSLLIERVKEAGQISSIESILDWDSETYMPPNGLSARAEQLSLIAGLAHQRRTDPKVGEYLAGIDERALDEMQKANVRETRRNYERAVKIPPEIVKQIAKASTLAKDAWGKARADNDFPSFAPHLKTLVDLKRKVAELIGFRGEPYDALMDEFEPGMSTAEVAAVFDSLRGPLAALVKQIGASRTKPDESILHRHFPRTAQEQFGRRLAEAIGFDFLSGRLDVSKHPFCSGTSPGDVRLTTRYYEDFFSPSVFGVLHEAGHGMYEQGLDPAHMFTPMGQAVSMSIHESQSRMWENFVGRSKAFWMRFYPECQQAFGESLGKVDLDAFYAAINTVAPSLIRVEADEVTYNLHIILRFELERGLIGGSLSVQDVPEAWNAKMKELLGIVPKDNREGCLQDIHWSMGAFGYFPTYALGNLCAAQFFETAQRMIPDLTENIRRGEFGPLLNWLREKIHRHGQRYRAGELMKNVTGAALSAEPFLKYVREKFGAIYGS